jgi:hypothetical protein
MQVPERVVGDRDDMTFPEDPVVALPKHRQGGFEIYLALLGGQDLDQVGRWANRSFHGLLSFLNCSLYNLLKQSGKGEQWEGRR